MNSFVIRKVGWMQSVSLVEILLLFSYLTINIIGVGKSGLALPLLAAFLVISFSTFFLQALKGYIFIRLHLYFFLLFVLWVALRVIIDLSDIEYLKQIIIGTTGGILLFFTIGTFSKQALEVITKSKGSLFSIKILLLIFLIIGFLIFFNFQSRLLDRTDIFYIEGVEGEYQRPGNFLIMLFMMVSFIYVSFSSNENTKKKVSLIFWLTVYSSSFIITLVSSQMIGSNAATANLIAVYLITIVLSFLGFSKDIRQNFFFGKISLSVSKKLLKKIIKYSFVIIFFILFIVTVIVQSNKLDLQKTRIFGYGEGENTSVNTRFEIIRDTGADQMSYAPILGNLNVAQLTTGEAGKTLHNFIPNIIAELGLVGLSIVLSLFFLLFSRLIKTIRNTVNAQIGFQSFITNLWIFFILVFIFLYANISVDKSWSVMWFYVGFAVNVIYVKSMSYRILA